MSLPLKFNYDHEIHKFPSPLSITQLSTIKKLHKGTKTEHPASIIEPIILILPSPSYRWYLKFVFHNSTSSLCIHYFVEEILQLRWFLIHIINIKIQNSKWIQKIPTTIMSSFFLEILLINVSVTTKQDDGIIPTVFQFTVLK